MNAKKYVVTAIVLNVVLLTFAASFWQTRRVANASSPKALTGPSGKFGPTIDAELPAAKADEGSHILNLETGGALLQPPSEYFNSRANVIMGWIRSNSLDISCLIWPDGAACVTYDMTIVAVERKCWKATTEEELLGNPALASGQHSPRRLLVLAPDRPDTYMFRTGDGNLGILQTVGLSPHGRGVNIRYRLVNPTKSPSIASRLSKS